MTKHIGTFYLGTLCSSYTREAHQEEFDKHTSPMPIYNYNNVLSGIYKQEELFHRDTVYWDRKVGLGKCLLLYHSQLIRLWKLNDMVTQIKLPVLTSATTTVWFTFSTSDLVALVSLSIFSKVCCAFSASLHSRSNFFLLCKINTSVILKTIS